MSRSRWKFNYIAQDFLMQLKNNEKNSNLILRNRATYITEDMLGTIVRVYNGCKSMTIIIDKDKIGSRLGEYAPSKKKAAKKKKIKAKIKKNT